eukprot:scaffold91042_cov24-Tisochrysis_lutea.AAC.1
MAGEGAARRLAGHARAAAYGRAGERLSDHPCEKPAVQSACLSKALALANPPPQARAKAAPRQHLLALCAGEVGAIVMTSGPWQSGAPLLAQGLAVLAPDPCRVSRHSHRSVPPDIRQIGC